MTVSTNMAKGSEIYTPYPLYFEKSVCAKAECCIHITYVKVFDRRGGPGSVFFFAFDLPQKKFSSSKMGAASKTECRFAAHACGPSPKNPIAAVGQ
jgi:hypothetical protein